ncbi:unnamed protein product [Symbiodinium sp. CCMP2592]|nr:unnamed protein product [Symbiodinium sp. CCMP2592]
MEGELAGPSYGAATTEPPGLSQANQQPSGTNVVMNGVVEDPQAAPGPQETLGGQVPPQPLPQTPEPAAPRVLEHTLPELPGVQLRGSSVPLQESEPTFVQAQQRVEVSGFEFSPPEELPPGSRSPGAGTGNQGVWFMRLQEFVQKRVSQASAAMMTPLIEARQRSPAQVAQATTPRPPRLFTPEAEQAMQQWSRRAPHLYTPEQRRDSSSSGSLTQEQMLAEVQKQVKMEMRSHEEQRQVLVEENQQLKVMLERLLTQVQNQAAEDQGDEVNRGIPVGLQGSGEEAILPDYVPLLLVLEDILVMSNLAAKLRGVMKYLEAILRTYMKAVQVQEEIHLVFLAERSRGLSLRMELDRYLHGLQREGKVCLLPKEQPLLDPIGTLVQGMAQLQTAMSESLSTRSKEPEVVKPGLSELPRLADLSNNSAIDVGDWLHGLQNHMGDLSNGSGQWWTEVLQCLTSYYDAYLKASHVGKLTLKAEDYETAFLKDSRWTRVDKRASSMILTSLPTKVKDEVLSMRLVGTLPTLCRVMVLYRPGSLAERQQILRALEQPTVAQTASEAVDELRKWGRWMGRATDLGVQTPDPSILVRGLDVIVKKILPENQDIAFRVSMLRYTLEVDTRPTERGARDLQQALMSELEQIAYRSRPASSGTPFVKAAMTTPPPPPPKPSTEAGGNTVQPKAKAKTPCRFYLTDKGDRGAQGDSFLLDYRYGDHYSAAQQQLCAIDSLIRATDHEIEAADQVHVQLADGKEIVLAQSPSGTLLTRKAARGSSGPIVPLGALVQDLGCQVSWTRKGGLTIRHPEHGLIKPKVVGRCPVVAESQALDLIYEIECQKLRQLEFATKATAKSVWLWDVEKPWARHLDDFVRVGGRGAQLRAMSTEGSPFGKWPEMDRALVAENVELDNKAGWSYLRALPGSRQRRKRLMSSSWVIHLYSGPDKGIDPLFRELDDGRVFVQVDINRSKAEDVGMVAGVYRALLWAAATGRVDGIIGSPPTRVDLVQKMMWLMMVAKAARAHHGGHPVFAMMEGKKLMDILRIGGVAKWLSVTESWDPFTEAMCLEEVGENWLRPWRR